jgi:DNA-binding MarR family transcriptional regulator
MPKPHNHRPVERTTRQAARAKVKPGSGFEPFGEAVIDRIVAEWNDVVPRQDAVAREIAAIVSRIATLMQKDTQRVLGQFGLLDTEFRLLAGLRRAGPPFCSSPSELSPRYVPLTSGGLTGVINRLARRKLVRRLVHPHDRRGVLVELTAHGRKLIEAAMGAVAARESSLIAGLNAAQRRHAAQLLRQLLRAANTAFGVSPYD